MKKGFFSGFVSGAFAALIITAVSIWVVGLILSFNRKPSVIGTPTPQPTNVAGASATPTPTPNYNVSGDLLARPFVDKMQLLADIISTYYYKDVEVDKLQDGILHALMDSIGDPYTVYYTKSEYDDFSESTNGVYYGIGAQVNQNIDTKSSIERYSMPLNAYINFSFLKVGIP